MNTQDQAIDQNFEFFHFDGNHEFKAGWYCREGFDGGAPDDDCHGSWNSEWEARRSMRQVFFG